MYDHEIRDVMSRFTHPILKPKFLLTRLASQYKVDIAIKNVGAVCARDVKMVFYWLKNIIHECGPRYRQRIVRGRITVPGMETDNVELTIPHFHAPIFPEDEAQITVEDPRLDFRFSIDKSVLNTIVNRSPEVVWTVYADDMPPQKGATRISDMEGFSGI